jgi:hydroxypyruvate reductase/glycerate 2-kinase
MVASMEEMRSIVEGIFRAALAAVDPGRAVAEQTEGLRARYREGKFERCLVIGFGKAAFPMALAIEENLGDLIDTGVIIVPYGHAGTGLRKVRAIEAGHPLPDASGVRGTEELIGLADQADERTLVVALVSGGGSALLVSPWEGITLAEKQTATSLLLKAGAGIGELNAVRKHLSRAKGGRLAALLHPATTVSLVVSDVIGNRLDVIASGPTAPDPSTFADALAVLEKYQLLEEMPQAVLRHLMAGSAGRLPETPKEEAPVFRRVGNRIIADNRMALAAAREAAAGCGLNVEILSAEIAGEAREAGRWLAHKAIAAQCARRAELPLCLLSGGETTVTVRGKGVGGRNMELALAFAREIDGVAGITLLSAGTDGRDGPTDAAGAVVDGNTIPHGKKMGLNPSAFLADNDSYSFFHREGGLFVTGPTGTNVMDIQVVVIADGREQREPEK